MVHLPATPPDIQNVCLWQRLCYGSNFHIGISAESEFFGCAFGTFGSGTACFDFYWIPYPCDSSCTVCEPNRSLRRILRFRFETCPEDQRLRELDPRPRRFHRPMRLLDFDEHFRLCLHFPSGLQDYTPTAGDYELDRRTWNGWTGADILRVARDSDGKGDIKWDRMFGKYVSFINRGNCKLIKNYKNKLFFINFSNLLI